MFTKTAVVRRLAAAVGVSAMVLTSTAPGQALAPALSTPAQLTKNPPIAACDTLVRIEPSQLPSRYSWPVYWSLVVNFKAFENGDVRRPYACLRLFGRDTQSGSYVDLSLSGKGVPITGCEVQGRVPMSSHSLPGLSTTVGVASFTNSRRNGYIACELNLRDTVVKLHGLGQITSMPDGSTPSLELFQTYDAFAYAVVASLTGMQPAGFVQYSPGNNCYSDASALGIPIHCGATSYDLTLPSSGLLDHRTVTDGQVATTRSVLENSHGFVDDNCQITPVAHKNPRIWSSYRGQLDGYGNRLHHLILDITNTHMQALCELPGGQSETPFYTGQSMLYLGGVPGATSAWGELYEVTADPGGSSTGTDGVK